MPPFSKTILQPGDAVLYRPRDVFDWAVAFKTWTKVSHIEIYAGNDLSFASRNGLGVCQYSARYEDVAAVLRPKWEDPAAAGDDLLTAEKWFWEYANGQKYDWRGLLCFTLAVKAGARRQMYCSEFATRFYRQAGLHPFALRWDADRTPPSLFLASPAFEWIWTDGALI